MRDSRIEGWKNRRRRVVVRKQVGAGGISRILIREGEFVVDIRYAVMRPGSHPGASSGELGRDSYHARDRWSIRSALDNL
jgi:hypothetical protein